MTVLDAPAWTPYESAERPVPPPVHPAVAALQAALAGVARAQFDGSLARGSLIDTAALARAAESAQGLALRELAAVDTTRTHTTVGRASTAGWLADVLTLDDTTARARVRLARRLTDDLDRVSDLLLIDGGTTVAHTAALHTGLRGLSPDVIATSQSALVVLAQHLDPPSLARELRERAHAVNDDLSRDAERRQRQRAGVQVSELLDGCVSIRGLLAPQDGQALLLVLDAHIRARRQSGDDRDAPARRAEALAALAHHALHCPDAQTAGQGGSRAQILVLCDADTLTATPGAPGSTPGRTPGRTPATFPGSHTLLSHDTLRRLTCDADTTRIVLGPGGAVLDLGRTTRTVTPAQWKALIARDQHCVIRGCRRRPTESQAHHVRHWTRGGPSDLSNYALVCHQHHHELHEGQQTLQHHDGRWLTPDGYQAPRPGPPPF